MRILGIKSDIFNYLSIILPVIDLIVIAVCGFTSKDPFLTIPLNFVFPLVGVSSLKFAEKINNKWPISVSMFFLSIYGGFFTYISGLSSPGWIVAITYVPAVIFLFDSKIQQLIYLLILAIEICIVEYVLGNSINNIVVIMGIMFSFTLIIERSVEFLIKQQSKIFTQKQEIETKNFEIFQSLNYAQRIQKSLLPIVENNSDLINLELFYQPKEIVSGDFYWKHETKEKLFFAVCDSTGHGVPGAMMSVLNINLLNEAVNNHQLVNTGEIFDCVRSKLIQQLDQNEQKDGFDGVILSIDKDSKSLNYSCANNQFILFRNNEIIISEKDRMPVGKTINQVAFKTFNIQLQKNDVLFLYTDGFPDQFGGEKGKKLKTKVFNDVLINNAHQPFEEFLSNFLVEWKGNLEQVDDICVCKIKIL